MRAILVLLAEALVFFWLVLFVPHYVIPWDLRYYHLPLASTLQRALLEGRLPLWDPFVYCGMPVYANLTAQAFYPPTLIAVLLAGDHLLYALEVQLVAHVFLGGLFAYLLMRRLGAGTAAALAGGTVYELGAFFASQAQHLGAVDAAAWMPLGWLAIVALDERFTWRWLACLAAALAMTFLSGFPAVTAVVYLSCFLFAAVRRSWRGLVYSVAGIVWAVLLAAVQFFPTLELTRRSVAQYRGDFMGTGGGLPWQSLISLVWPNYWGIFQFRGATWRLPWNVTFLYDYCGLIALILAFWAAFSRKGRPFAILTAVAALWMLGDSTPVGRVLFPLLPPVVRSSLYAEFALPVFTLGVAVLAASGAGRLLARHPRWAPALVAAMAVDLIFVGSGRPMNTADDRIEPGVAYEHVDGSRALADGVRRLVNQAKPASRIDTVNGSLTWSTAASLIEVPTANGDDPFALVRLMQVRLSFCKGERWGRWYEPVNPDSPVLKLLNVRYVLSRSKLADPGGLVWKESLPGTEVYENPGALPRFFLVGRVLSAANMEQALRALRSADFDPRAEAVAEGPAPAAAASGTVRLLRYEAEGWAVETDAPAPSFLVTSEAWYPGWRAWIDGHEQAPILTNAAFRGMPVPAGRHTIEMRFEPAILPRSAAVSGIAGLALLAALLQRPAPRKPH